MTKSTSAGQGHFGIPTVGVGGFSGKYKKGVGYRKTVMPKGKNYTNGAVMKAVSMTANPKVKQVPIKLGDKKGFGY